MRNCLDLQVRKMLLVYESRRSYVLSDGIVCIHQQLKNCIYAHECTFVTQLYRSPTTCISFLVLQFVL
jgi:hypothetical protein